MKQLHEVLIFPCRNKEKGCSELVPGSSIGVHELGCYYSWMHCTFGASCGWVGSDAEFLQHYFDVHRLDIVSAKRFLYSANDFDYVLEGKVLHKLLFFDKKIFHCIFIGNKDGFKWRVFCIWHEDVSSQYIFKVKVRVIGRWSFYHTLSARAVCSYIFGVLKTATFPVKFEDYNRLYRKKGLWGVIKIKRRL